MMTVLGEMMTVLMQAARYVPMMIVMMTKVAYFRFFICTQIPSELTPPEPIACLTFGNT